MKKITKVLSLLLSIVCAFSVGVGCSSNIDPNKTQLYIGNFDAGVGTQWLYEVVERFKEEYKDHHFEEGKTGVQVFVDPQANYTGGGLVDGFNKNKNYVMFAEQVNYNDFVQKGLLLDISDLVKNENYTGQGTLESKLLNEQKKYLKIDDSYYALPHYQIFSTIVYDIDLFEDELLYISANPNNGNSGIVASETEAKGAGPDGVSGNEDDGFPATFDELKKLIKYMSVNGITPFIWPGKHVGYLNKVATAIAASYNGKIGIDVQATFDSQGQEVEVITGFDGQGNPLITKEVITKENGYLAKQLTGMYYGMDMVEYILSDNAFSTSSARNGTDSQTDAQTEYIYSRYDKENYDRQPIAFMCEGGYWEIESERSMANFKVDYPDSLTGGRHFGSFPLPTATGQTASLNDTASAFAFINANIADNPVKVNVAKEFLKFCYSNAELQNFTVRTGVTRGIKYNLDNANYNKLTDYQKQIWDTRLKGDWATVYDNNNIFLSHYAEFSMTANTEYWTTNISGSTHTSLYSAIYDKGKTAKEYFSGRWISPQVWASSYNNI